MITDEERVRWEIAAVRDAISLDWANLASKNLPPEKRKAISQHLEMCTSALRDLVKRNRSCPCSKAYPVWESICRWRSRLTILISRIEHPLPLLRGYQCIGLGVLF